MYKPELLSQCNIPKPLHGLNPRNIMGKDKWDVYRQGVYKSTDYHCKACGVHKTKAKKYKWLEAHEDFEIDYNNKKMVLREVIPLCHYCHQFIHSGFLYVNFQKNNDEDHIVNVLTHGFDILERNNLKAFPFTIQLAEHFDISVNVKEIELPHSFEWGGWKMVWDGVEYDQKFKTEQEWKSFYNR